MATWAHMQGRRSRGVRPVTWTVCALLLVVAAGPATAQMTGTRMVMPTDDHKVFRLIRPAVAALQIELAEAGSFSGAINGLLGPSTVRSLVAYQHSHGLEATGLPDLETVLDLMGWDGAYEGVLEHLDLESTTEAMGGHRVDGGLMTGMPSMGEDDMKGSTTGGERVQGDPQQPKSLVLMEMPAMVADNRHTRAVRAARELLAGLQLRLIEEHFLDGPARGLPQEASFADGITRYQESHGLDATGVLDLATTLELLGSEGERLVSKYRNRIDLTATPVAMDEDLMRLSNGRGSTPLGGR